MARVMAVAFEPNGQLHYLDPGDGDYRIGDWVLHPTESGPEVARVIWAPEWVDGEGFNDVPVCVGPASTDQLDRDEANKQRRAEAEVVAKALIAEHDLPMKVVGVDFVDQDDDFDQLVVIYYTAPGRVDFRALVGDLAHAVRARIDLRQIGQRDAARVIGGIGNCGRDLCCSTFLDVLEPISMRLAKSQHLPANPLQISGQCGRLMCCLKYEHPLYADFARKAPAVGEDVDTPDGPGRVIGHSVPSESVRVRLDEGEIVKCPLLQVCSRAGRAREQAARKDADDHA